MSKIALPYFVVAFSLFVITGLFAPSAIAAPPKARKDGLVPTKHAPRNLPVKVERVMFGAGCFWGVEQEFRKTKGVLATAVGYAGGYTKNPTYEEVCSDTTRHAEVVLVEYDPKIVSYDKLLNLFWDIHDPTLLNRQGPDIGSQYRSAVYYYNEEQKKTTLASREKLQQSGELEGKIVTEIVVNPPFYKAEEYHQQYVEKGGIASCHRRKKK